MKLHINRVAWVRTVAAVALISGVGAAHAQKTLDPETEINPFAAEVAAKHGVDEQYVRDVVAGAKILPHVLEAMSRPAEGVMQWRKYRKIFLTEKRVAGGAAFWKKHKDIIAAASKKFLVDEAIIVSIIGVETYYGARAGNIRVLDALATLGFRFPRRAKFFRSELGHYMALAKSEGLDVSSVVGSYAGAMGIPQFIPSSYQAYAVDFDGDGKRDLVGNVADAIGSVASYFSHHGWQAGAAVTSAVSIRERMPQSHLKELLDKGLNPHSTVAQLSAAGVAIDASTDADREVALLKLVGVKGDEYWLAYKNFYVITRYNRSPLYAMAVYQLSLDIAKRYGNGA